MSRGIEKVTLDKERTLKYSLNSMIMLEEHGVNVSELGTDTTMSTVRLLVWAGLKHEDPEITIEYVGEIMDMGSLAEVMEAVGRALSSNGKK